MWGYACQPLSFWFLENCYRFFLLGWIFIDKQRKYMYYMKVVYKRNNVRDWYFQR